MLVNILRFKELTVEDVMVPRADILAVSKQHCIRGYRVDGCQGTAFSVSCCTVIISTTLMA